ncbi:hypothetical protein J6590_023264, partial [Homalodisca vitripennis]
SFLVSRSHGVILVYPLPPDLHHRILACVYNQSCYPVASYITTNNPVIPGHAAASSPVGQLVWWTVAIIRVSYLLKDGQISVFTPVVNTRVNRARIIVYATREYYTQEQYCCIQQRF